MAVRVPTGARRPLRSAAAHDGHRARPRQHCRRFGAQDQHDMHPVPASMPDTVAITWYASDGRVVASYSWPPSTTSPGPRSSTQTRPAQRHSHDRRRSPGLPSDFTVSSTRLASPLADSFRARKAIQTARRARDFSVVADPATAATYAPPRPVTMSRPRGWSRGGNRSVRPACRNRDRRAAGLGITPIRRQGSQVRAWPPGCAVAVITAACTCT
jgi:hypothetical protein